MKILKRGKVQPHYEFRGTCPTCGCEAEFTRDEAKVEKGDRPFDADAFSVGCPTPNCRDRIYGKRIIHA